MKLKRCSRFIFSTFSPGQNLGSPSELSLYAAYERICSLLECFFERYRVDPVGEQLLRVGVSVHVFVVEANYLSHVLKVLLRDTGSCGGVGDQRQNGLKARNMTGAGEDKSVPKAGFKAMLEEEAKSYLVD